MKRYLLATTGGSGAGYALRYLWHLLHVPGETHWIPSPNFFRVLKAEHGVTLGSGEPDVVIGSLLKMYGDKEIRHKLIRESHPDIGARAASGSARYESMVVLPCSMKTLSAIAAGITTNLIERAADVSLKERRPLVLVPREAPYSSIHLENMLRIANAGGVILPASPGFYHNPSSITDIYDFIVDRVFQHAGIPVRTIKPWEGSEAGAQNMPPLGTVEP